MRAYLDSNTVTKLDLGLIGSNTELLDDSNTLVASHLTFWSWIWKDPPRVGHDAHIGMADARVCAKSARISFGFMVVASS